MMKTPKNTANAARTKARKVSDCSTSPCTFICTCKVAHAPGPNIHFLWLKLKLLHHDCNKTLPERLKIPFPWLGSEFGLSVSCWNACIIRCRRYYYLPSLASVQRVTKLPHRAIANSSSASCRPEHMCLLVSTNPEMRVVYALQASMPDTTR